MTAMQELLIHFNELNESGWFTFDEVEQAILEHGMPLEKKQIIDAFDEGGIWPIDGKQYYNQTYGNEAAATPAT